MKSNRGCIEKIETIFIDACREFGANSKYEINAVQGQTLNLDRSSKMLNGLVKASSISGHPIKLLSKESNAKWVSTGTGSAMWMNMNEKVFSDNETIFNDGYEMVAQEMNKYK